MLRFHPHIESHLHGFFGCAMFALDFDMCSLFSSFNFMCTLFPSFIMPVSVVMVSTLLIFHFILLLLVVIHAIDWYIARCARSISSQAVCWYVHFIYASLRAGVRVYVRAFKCSHDSVLWNNCKHMPTWPIYLGRDARHNSIYINRIYIMQVLANVCCIEYLIKMKTGILSGVLSVRYHASANLIFIDFNWKISFRQKVMKPWANVLTTTFRMNIE